MDWSILGLLALATLVRAEETCLNTNRDPYLLYGTKTEYEYAIRGLSNQERVHQVPGCQPVAFWLLNRHGSHNPEADEIEALQRLTRLRDNIKENYNNSHHDRDANQQICYADQQSIERWQWNPQQNLTFAGAITSPGYMTTQQIAQTWRSRYPTLLTDNRNDYLFKFANDSRSVTTFQAFTDGLFRAAAWGEGYGIPKNNNEKELKPYKYCPTWSEEVGNNSATMEQVNIFKSKQEYKEMLSNVSRRLGFTKYDLDLDTVHRMYQMCRYNVAWNIGQVSPWCAAFSREDLRRLEYVEDLETYYKYGYGSPTNLKLGCSLIKDMMEFFNLHVNNELPQQPQAQIHLSDAPMIMFTLAALGARRDPVPLTGDNYHTNQMQARKWTTSTMSPFNANLAAVLFKCNTNGNGHYKDKYQVLLLENYQPMYFKRCRVGLCDWTYIKETLGDLGAKCDLGFCNGGSRLNGFLGLFLTLILSLTRFVL